MTINNQNRAAWIKLMYYILIFLYLATTILLIYLEVEPIYPIVGALTGFVVSFIVISLLFNYNYIIFQESEDKVIVRYYPLHPFHHNFKSIEISKATLSHYELKSGMFGMRSELTLYQITNKGLAKYPPVSLSAVSKKNKEKIIETLKRSSSKK